MQDSEAQHKQTDSVRASARSTKLLVNGYSGLFWVHALAVCPGPKTACKHWGTVPEAAIFAFRLLKVVSQGTPFARAREGCGLRDKALLRCVLVSATHGCGARWDHWVFVIKKHVLKNLGPKMCTRIERGVAIKFAHIYVAVVVYLRHTVLNPRAAILYKLKLDQTVSTISTVGFNVETFTYKKVKFTVWVRFFFISYDSTFCCLSNALLLWTNHMYFSIDRTNFWAKNNLCKSEIF